MKSILKIIKWTSIIIVSITVLLLITSTVRNRIGNCEFDAEIDGLGTTVALVRCGHSIKLTLCLNNKINCKVTTNTLTHADFCTPASYTKLLDGGRYGMESKWVKFFINKGDKILIKGKIHQAGINYTISGSCINSDYSDFLNENTKFLQKTIQLDIERKNLIIKGADEKQISDKLILQKEQVHLFKMSKMDFIKNNPDHVLATFFLSRFEKDTIAKYADLIKSEARKTKYWDIIVQELAFKKIIVLGNTTPELNEKDINEIQIDLKDFKGKYVVLDFWGSWCAPCKIGLPKMKEYYENYKVKFEFIGIACDDKESDLKKIIDEYELKWTQILNKKDNDLGVKFEIEAYPTKIILDPNGAIIGIFKGENLKFYEKIDDLMSTPELKTTTNK